MHISVGTFNVNNLFSRFNFELRAEVEKLPEGKVPLTKIRQITDEVGASITQYEGWALQRKDPLERLAVAERIKEMDLDIIALQEVEDINTLRYFAEHDLGKLYPHAMLIEGNDPRLIDVAVLSKFPLGKTTTWQAATNPKQPDARVFGRDLLQVDILSKDRTISLLTLFVTHLKSHFVPFNVDQEEGATAANEQRRQQAETAALIIETTMPNSEPYIVLGDFNDAPDSAFLRSLTDNFDLKLVNGLTEAKQTRPAPKTSTALPTKVWTYRFKPTGKAAEYYLYDQIWLSEGLAPKLTAAYIDRRTKMTGDGSDHDPAWVELDV